MMMPADELAHCELPTHQDDQHDPQLDHQIGRGEHEDHGRHEVGPLDEEGLGHRRGRVGTRRRHHPVPRCPQRRPAARWSPSRCCRASRLTKAWTAPAIPNPSTSGQSVAQNMKKPSRSERPMSTRTVAVASTAVRSARAGRWRPTPRAASRWPRRRPVRTASDTQWARWSSSSSSATAWSALVAADTCSRMSMQYRSSSTMRCRPLTWPFNPSQPLLDRVFVVDVARPHAVSDQRGYPIPHRVSGTSPCRRACERTGLVRQGANRSSAEPLDDPAHALPPRHLGPARGRRACGSRRARSARARRRRNGSCTGRPTSSPEVGAVVLGADRLAPGEVDDDRVWRRPPRARGQPGGRSRLRRSGCSCSGASGYRTTSSPTRMRRSRLTGVPPSGP